MALYSTFLQRAFDQVVHDVCQNDVPVVIGVDRAGLVGEDGTSHQGMFTLSAQRQLPNLVMASPRDEQELRRLLRTAFAQEHPFALQYPRDAGFDLPAVEPLPVPVGRASCCARARTSLIVGFGPIVARGLDVAEALGEEGWSVAVIDARFAEPLDRDLILGHGGRQATGRDAGGERRCRAASAQRCWRLLADAADGAGAATWPVSPHRHPGRSVRRPRLGGRPARVIRLDEAGIHAQVDGGHRVARPHADRAPSTTPAPAGTQA